MKNISEQQRAEGRFFTPHDHVDLLWKYIKTHYGERVESIFNFWDCCCGTKHLTRSHFFPNKNLFVSTLKEDELLESEEYNREAVHTWRYDFLNDSLTNLPHGLQHVLDNNLPLFILINPPYGTANNKGTDDNHKAGVAKTTTNTEMIANGWGKSAQNLYGQFLYRIWFLKRKYNLTKLSIGLISPTSFLCGSSWKEFRKKFLSDFKFVDGYMFQASHFDGLAGNWSIGFTLWESGVQYDDEFWVDVVEKKDGELVKTDIHKLWNVDNTMSLSEWTRQPINNLPTYDSINLSSAIKVKTTGSTLGRTFDNALGYYLCGGNSIEKGMQSVSLMSAPISMGHGHAINSDNFFQTVMAFSARRLVSSTWINWQDEFTAPYSYIEEDILYKQFRADSLVYCLFNNKSNQSSLRDVIYKDVKYDIINHFFFEDPKEFGVEDNTRFMTYKLVEELPLMSAEARNALTEARRLLKLSLPYREKFNEQHPEYQIMNWDCGWYQIRALLKEFLKPELTAFNDLYQKLALKMEPVVYNLGFLRDY